MLEVRRDQPSHLEDAKRPFRMYGLPEMRSRGQCEQLILEVQAAAQHRINPSFAKAAPLLGVPIEAAIFIPPIETKVPAPTRYLPALPIILVNVACTGAVSFARPLKI